MFHLVEPDLGRISGGLRYNWAVVDAADAQLQRHAITGGWPNPSEQGIAVLTDLLDSLNGPVLLDGLIGCSLPDPLAVHTPIVQLVHALAETPEATRREQHNLQAADAVVATSQFTADQLHKRHGIQAVVAAPGVEERPMAVGDVGGSLISVGAVEPNKNQVFIAEVLEQLTARNITGWHCTFAGPLTDADYAQQLQQTLATLPAGTTTVAGELDATQLAALYHHADLLLLPSQAETFGLVVREALAAGVPAFVTAGTGAEEALGGGEALRLDQNVWAEKLHQWLTDAHYRRHVKAVARTARKHLSFGWHATAEIILDVLRSVSAH